MPPNPAHVVIGAGQAGGRAVEAMRSAGFTGRITLIGAEAYVPYERPPLSKQLLIGDVSPDRAFLHDAGFYREQGIELRLCTRVTAIDRKARRVHLRDGESLAYDKLLITTGARPRELAVPGAGLPGLYYLRDIDDALALRHRLVPDVAVTLVGGGYIGLEVAAAACSRGCRVGLVETEGTLMHRAVATEVADFIAGIHRAHGVDVRTGVTVTAFEGRGRIERVVCADGTRLPTDVAVVGIGIVPNAELATEAGLDVGDGIVVDDFGRTSDAAIFAAGDVANHPVPPLGRRLRLESWQNAQNQAIAVARVMCGSDEPYAELPWFWTDQYDLNLQMVGLPQRWNRLVFRGEPDRHKFSVFYLDDDVVVAANALNSPRDLRFARKLIEEGIAVDPDRLADPDTPLKSLLAR